MVQIVTFLTPGDATFTVPAGVTNIDLVQGIGGGMGGATEQTVAFDGFSGGGGGYAERINWAVTPGQVINLHVGAGSAGQFAGIGPPAGEDTWFGASVLSNPLCAIIAKGGIGPGAPQTGNYGTNVFAGPSGVLEAFEFGSGAGGRGGNTPVPIGTIMGGQGGNGHGGHGGQFQIPPSPSLEAGIAGTEIDGIIGSGGGGGTAVNNNITGGNGGDGGLYGGGGGSGNNPSGSRGGNGAGGMIRLVIRTPPFFVVQGGVIRIAS